MSSIAIADLAQSRALDSRAMSAIRGGSSPFGKDVNVNVNVNQQIGQFQQIGINVLNNSVVGAGFKGPDIDVAAALWAENNVVV